jgi:hypothetical protein
MSKMKDEFLKEQERKKPPEDIDYDYELYCDHITEARWEAGELEINIYEDR